MPLETDAMPENCQPLSSAPFTPVRPCPNGNTYTVLNVKLWGTSNDERPRSNSMSHQSTALPAAPTKSLLPCRPPDHVSIERE